MTTPQPVQEPAGAVEALISAALQMHEALHDIADESDAEGYLGEADLLHSAANMLKRLAALASLPPVTQAKSEAVAWGYSGTVGNAIAQLRTFDPSTPFYAAMHLQDGRCIARGVTISRERVVNDRWIDSKRDDVPYSIVVWSQHEQSPFAAPQEAVERQPLTDAQIDLGFESWADDYPILIVGYLHDYCSDAFRAGIELARPSVHGISPATQEKQHG